MSRDDIIRMAREAFGVPYSSYLEKRRWDISNKQVERFAALVAEHEREHCAQVCEENANDLSEGDWDSACINCADHIRARGEK